MPRQTPFALLLVSIAQTQGLYTQEFKDWAVKFDKNYATPEERDRSYQIYQTNDHHIKSVNSQNLTHKLGHNQFSDLTPEYFYNTYVGHQDKHSYLDHRGTNVHEITNTDIPSSIDWSAKGAVTKTKNQGQCGSCWAFSTTGSLEGAYEIASGTLDSLSEQQLVDCDHDGGDDGCNGGAMDNAYGWIESNGGICLDAAYPYAAVGQPCRHTCKPAVTLTGHVDVPKGNETQLKAAIALGPVSIAIEADKSAFQFYTSGVFNDKTCGNKLDHGVLAVGYGTMSPGGDYYKVKNSWGSTWGDQGYILIAQHNDICGIADAACYPTGVRAANGTKPPSPSPSPPGPGNKWKSIDEKDCTDAACTKCKDNGSFNANTCLETTDAGLFIIGNCSADGNSINEFTFNDKSCTEQTGSYPSKANTCLENPNGGYTLYTCGTSPAPPSPGPSPSCTNVYPDCVGNADQASCDQCSKCQWCSNGFYCSNDSCP